MLYACFKILVLTFIFRHKKEECVTENSDTPIYPHSSHTIQSDRQIYIFFDSLHSLKSAYNSLMFSPFIMCQVLNGNKRKKGNLLPKIKQGCSAKNIPVIFIARLLFYFTDVSEPSHIINDDRFSRLQS